MRPQPLGQVVDLLGRHDLLAERRSVANDETVAPQFFFRALGGRSQLSASLALTTVGAGACTSARGERGAGRTVEERGSGRRMT